MNPANEWKARTAKWFDPLTNVWRDGVFFRNVSTDFPEMEVGAVIGNVALAGKMADAIAALPVLATAAMHLSNEEWDGTKYIVCWCASEVPLQVRKTHSAECDEIRSALKSAGVEIGQ